MSNTLISAENVEVEPDKDVENGLDKVEQSAQYLNVLFTQFREYGYSLAKRKKRAPIRVLESLVFEGLEEAFVEDGLPEIKLSGKEEKELLALCHQVVYHKMVIAKYAAKRKEDKGELNE